MQLIGPKSDYISSDRYLIAIDGKNYLLIYQSENYFLLENKCGHFGISLFDGDLKDNTIICSGHGISFDLTTGEIVNRPYENCDKLNVFKVVDVNGLLYFTK